MGKNRPPRQVRELLIELEKLKASLVSSSRPDVTSTVQNIERLIACAPDEYVSFINDAKRLLQSQNDTAAVQCSGGEHSDDDAAGGDFSISLVDDALAWKSVCEVRAELHARLRNESECSNPTNRWRRSRQRGEAWEESGVAGSIGHRPGIAIVPKISFAFVSQAALGRRQYVPPKLQTASRAKTAQPSRAPQATGGTVVWIRPFDLRIHDNPALTYAASLNSPVHLVFAWSEEEDATQGKWRIGGTAASFWLHHALAALDSDYRKWYGQSINFLLDSSTVGALRRAVQETGARCVVTSTAYDILGRRIDRDVQTSLQSDGVEFLSFNSFLLNDIDKIQLDMGEKRGCFGTLVPFLFACNAHSLPPKPAVEPRVLLKASGNEIRSGVSLPSLNLCRLPVRADGSVLDWGAPILDAWYITEEGALAAMRAFLATGGALSRYEAERHLADASAVARISPYLRFGMLSCRSLYWEAKAANASEVSKTFWRRLVWRDLAYWQLGLFPHMADEPIRSHYAGQVWNTDVGALDRWRKGRTGFPLVDAGMRELWATGWMAQNVRMVVALFLVEYLNIHWLEGARWFHHTLVDADPAINPMMWQNAGKSGLDQWNFTMNPAEFGRRMDPSGDYVRRWCPELKSLPARFIHCPWEAPVRLQKHLPAGAYPDAIVQDLEAAAGKSRTAILDQRSRRRGCSDDGGYDTIVLPKGSTLAHDGLRVRLFTKKELRFPSRRVTDAEPDEKRATDFQAVLGDYVRKRS